MLIPSVLLIGFSHATRRARLASTPIGVTVPRRSAAIRSRIAAACEHALTAKRRCRRFGPTRCDAIFFLMKDSPRDRFWLGTRRATHPARATVRPRARIMAPCTKAEDDLLQHSERLIKRALAVAVALVLVCSHVAVRDLSHGRHELTADASSGVLRTPRPRVVTWRATSTCASARATTPADAPAHAAETRSSPVSDPAPACRRSRRDR